VAHAGDRLQIRHVLGAAVPKLDPGWFRTQERRSREAGKSDALIDEAEAALLGRLHAGWIIRRRQILKEVDAVPAAPGVD